MSAADAERHEIIIVRRGGEGEDGHHGGAWKIAFADFMTAMMAFFLVMWLTSVSDDATKKQIAQYFNPIELNSALPPTAGLSQDNTEATAASQSLGETQTLGTAGGKPVGGEAQGGQDQALFRDPYAVLAEIVAESGNAAGSDKSAGKPDGSGLPGLNGGDAYRDPFDPTSWQLTPNALQGKQVEVTPDDFATVAVEPKPPEPQAPPAATPAAPVTAEQKDAAELERQIEASVPSQDGADVEVKSGEAGSGTVTISLADTLDTGMFQIGSARPTADAIRLMEKIAAILKDRPGEIVIRGHTDARPFSGGGQVDNWRLSTDRAHMAYYMLRRGGLDDKRVEAIEGVADRQPSNASDPDAASNRRIEILLKEPKT
ncbi:flagellar motor protein MotB [Aureimonas sp. SK2]|uniref:flagellar motor protein MotB n=1 Tax=Aureimonas sp. SK2 TaxID=3015992 RepID=UPI0024440547|nr:flagellar motor protein MotB [Aureimonas sp. SK2]